MVRFYPPKAVAAGTPGRPPRLKYFLGDRWLCNLISQTARVSNSSVLEFGIRRVALKIANIVRIGNAWMPQ
jgi:hypothetical protein